MLNKITIIGHLGKDPESKEFNGKRVWNLNVATSESYQDKNNDWQTQTQWFNVSLWREGISERLIKGALVYIEGKMQSRLVETQSGKKEYWQLSASHYKVLSSEKSISHDSKEQRETVSIEPDNDLPF